MYLDKVSTADTAKQTFKQIIDLYNSNFEQIKNYLITLGDSFVHESFTGSTSGTITFENYYTPGKDNLMVYFNGVIQWKDLNYTEKSTNSIVLKFDRKENDTIDIIIVQSNFLQTNIDSYVSELQSLYEKASNNVIAANSLYNTLSQLSSDLSASLEQYEESKYSIKDTLDQIKNYVSEVTALYNNTITLKSQLKSYSDSSQLSASTAEGYAKDAKDTMDAIKRLGVLDPSNITDNEVLDARGGYAVLGDRINTFSPSYKTSNDMIADTHIKAGMVCFVFGESAINDDKQGVYYVVELDSTDSIAAEKYYELSAPASKEGYKLYAYQIGGFGTGNGESGTSDAMTFKVELDDTVYLELGSSLSIKYLYRSGNRSGTLYYSTDGYSYKEAEIDGPGYHTLDLGPFTTQEQLNLRMYIVDSEGTMSDTFSSIIKIGDLSATIISTTSSYNDDQNVSFRWRIEDIYGLPITSHINVIQNGTSIQTLDIENSSVGINSRNLGKLKAGHYKIELYLTNTSTTSKTYSYEFNVSSSTEIATYFVTTNNKFTDGQDIVILYGLLYNGTDKFTTEAYLNDTLYATLSTVIGENNALNLSGHTPGAYTIKLITKNAAGNLTSTVSTSIVIEETIVSELGVTKGAVIDLDSRFKSNSDTTERSSWGSKGVLKNFDYQNTGWILNTVDNDTKTTVLRCNGQNNYVDLAYCPFFIDDLDIATGITFNIKFKMYDLGDSDATIAECLDDSNKGFRIRTNSVRFNPFGSVDGTDAIKANFNTEVWHEVTLVVVKGITSQDNTDYGYYTDNDLAVVYMDGVVSGVIKGNIDTNFSMSARYDTILGAHFDRTLKQATNYAKCEIQHVRYYDKPLTYNEVLNNYISDIHDSDKQAELQKKNDYKNGIPGVADQTSLPVLTLIGCDLSAMDATGPSNAKNYEFPNVHAILTDPTGELGLKNNKLEKYGCSIRVQGTSSLNYSVKNYKLYYYKYEKNPELTDMLINPTTKDYYTENDLNNTGMYLRDSFKKVNGKLWYGEDGELPEDLQQLLDSGDEDGFNKLLDTYRRTKVSKDKVVPNKTGQWIKENVFTLKADYMESSHCRNTGSAQYLQGTLNSKGTERVDTFFQNLLPPQKPTDDNPYYIEDGKKKTDYLHVQATVSGFPCILIYTKPNGETVYKGIYNFNIDKNCTNHFGFGKYNDGDTIKSLSYEMANNESGGAGGFNMDASTAEGIASIQRDFEIRYHPMEDDALNSDGLLDINSDGTSKYNQQLVDLVNWVYSTKVDIDNGEYPQRFHDEVEKHFDLATLIDYYIFTRVMCYVDNLGKNCMLSTWTADQENIVKKDDGSVDYDKSTFAIWYPQFYDMDTGIGVDNIGNNVYESYHDIRGNTLDPVTFNTPDSVLWLNLEACFMTEIKSRYRTLRLNSKLSIENFEKYYFDLFVDKIGQYYYNRDSLVKYFGYDQYYYMCQGNARSHFINFMTKRLIYMDSIFGYNTSNIIFRNRKLANQTTTKINFGIKVSTPQYIDVQYTDNDVETKLCNSNTYTFFNKAITGNDSNITISGKPYITELTGLSYCNIETIDLSGATDLRIMDLANCNYLKDLTIGNNNWLTKIDISNTLALESSLDLSTLPELVELNAKNSAILALVLVGTNSSANNVRRIDLSGTTIHELNCSGLSILESIGKINLENYSNYASLKSMFDTYCLSADHINELLNTLKTELVTNGTVSSSDVVADLTFEQFFTTYGSQLSDEYIPGLIYMEPADSLSKLNLSYNNNIDAIYISPLDSSYQLGEEEFNISYMNQLKYLYLSYMINSAIDLTEDNELISVYLNNCTNITKLDLSGAYKLVNLQIPNSNSLEFIYLNDTMTTLKTLSLYYCLALKGIRYDTSDESTIGADLGKFELTDINFSTTLNLPSITNINATTNRSSVFYVDWRYQETALTTITGKIVFTTTSFQNMFYGREALSLKLGNGLEISMDNVTTMYEAFQRNKKLTYSDMIYIMKHVPKCVTYTRAFNNCTGISCNSLPADLFLNGQASGFESPAHELNYMFEGCSGMTNVVLPEGIFDPLVNVTNISNFITSGGIKVDNYYVSGRSIGINTSWLPKSMIYGTIPDTLFSKMKNLQYLDYFFCGSTITISNINTLFNNCSKIQRLTNIFAGSELTLTTAISKEFFKNLTACTNITGLFRGSNLSGVIPDSFYSYLTALTTAPYVFCGCCKITGLGNHNFMKSNDKLSDLKFMLAGSKIADTSIPSDLLPNDTSNTINRDISGLFFNCTLLGSANASTPNDNDLPQDFFNGQYNLLTASYLFGQCSNLIIRLDDTDSSGNEVHRFKDCRILNDLSGMFYHCSNLKGSIPAYGYEEALNKFYTKNLITGDYEYNPITNKKPGLFSAFDSRGNLISSPIKYLNHIFDTCRKLEGTIPGNLFFGLSKLENLSYAFYRCIRIGTLNNRELATRHLPYGLLDDCIALLDTSHMFEQARYAGRSKEEVDNPSVYEEMYDELYFLPKFFFSKCTKLQNVSDMFHRAWTNSTVSDEDADYYISSIYGKIYSGMFNNNTDLVNISNFLMLATEIQGYSTASYDNAIDYNLLQYNNKIMYINGAFYATAIAAIEIGFILKASQLVTIKAASDLTSPGLVTKKINNKYVGSQLVYDLENNSYQSMFDAYGVYVAQTYGF